MVSLRGFVLQYGGDCIARSGWIVLQPGGEIVLQGLHCIAIESAVGWIELYCNRLSVL